MVIVRLQVAISYKNSMFPDCGKGNKNHTSCAQNLKMRHIRIVDTNIR